MDDLITFLRARLAEAEEANRDHKDVDCCHLYCCYITDELGDRCDCGEPQRQIADVESKRQIIEFWSQAFSKPADFPGPAFDRVRSSAQWTLKKLALPFADHPAYREEFKP